MNIRVIANAFDWSTLFFFSKNSKQIYFSADVFPPVYGSARRLGRRVVNNFFVDSFSSISHVVKSVSRLDATVVERVFRMLRVGTIIHDKTISGDPDLIARFVRISSVYDFRNYSDIFKPNRFCAIKVPV